MADIRIPQNPGIGGIDELTLAEELTIQNISSLGDPNADRILFWDDSAGAYAFLTAGSGLSISGTTMTATGAVDGSGTTNQIAYWVDSDTLGALATATYPSLTELSYVKGVTSALQTQLDAKQALDTQLTSLAGLSYAGNAGKVIRVTAGEDGFEFVTAGAGDVTKVGTPVNNQIGVWTGDGTIEGDASLTWDGTSFNIATAKNFQIAGVTILADAAGTTTLSNIDAIDATTESTIEAAIDTLANLTSIQGRTVTLADAGANAIFGWDDVASAYENLTQAEVKAVIGDAAADGATKGVAGFNATNFSASSGIINTIQNIATTSSPQFTGIELGHATDTTVTRSSAGVIAVEGVVVPTISSTSTLTNKIISHTVEPGTDDTYTGECMTGILGGDTIAQWDLVYLDSTSGRWEFADADAAATAGGVLLALASAAGTDGGALTVVLRGVVRNDGWTWSGAGKPLYVSTTAAGMTETAPSGTDDVVRVVGYTLSDDCIYFNPSNDWITRV